MTRALLLVLLLAAPVRADEPAAPIRAPIVLLLAPDATPIPVTSDLSAKVGAVTANLQALAQQLGIPTATKLPAAFFDTTTGKVLMGIMSAVAIAGAVAQTTIIIRQELRAP